jgi:hypothetical protein
MARPFIGPPDYRQNSSQHQTDELHGNDVNQSCVHQAPKEIDLRTRPMIRTPARSLFFRFAMACRVTDQNARVIA